MTIDTQQPDLGSDQPRPTRCAQVAVEEAQPGARNPFELLNAAADGLQRAASCAVQAVSEAVSVATFCGTVQRCSVQLSLQPERCTTGIPGVDGVSESLNRGAQKSLSALRRLGEHQRLLLEGIEQTGQVLMKVVEEMQLRESRSAQERIQVLQDQRTNTELAQKIAAHAHNINQLMDKAWPSLREQGQ